MSNAMYAYSYSDSQGNVENHWSENIQDVHKFLETHVEEDRLEGYAGQDAAWHGTTEEGINWTVSVSSEDVIANRITDAVSAYPTELVEGGEDDAFDGHMVITEMTWADYADIQKLDQLFVNLSIQDYAELYHKLSSEHTEDAIVYQLNQYNSGITW